MALGWRWSLRLLLGVMFFSNCGEDIAGFYNATDLDGAQKYLRGRICKSQALDRGGGTAAKHIHGTNDKHHVHLYLPAMSAKRLRKLLVLFKLAASQIMNL